MFRSKETGNEFVDRYHKQLFKKLMLFIGCVAVMLVLTAYISLSYFQSITPVEALEVIFNHILGNEYEPRSLKWWADIYIWNNAMPRIFAAIIAGCGLAAAGSLMQSIMNNPLADPYSTGISSGACLGAIAAIVSGVAVIGSIGDYATVFNAFLGAMIPAAIIIILSRRIHMTPATLILAGTALSYFFNSVITYMMLSAEENALKKAYLWQVGNFDSINMETLPIMAAVTIVGSIIVYLLSKQLNIMSLGERSAKTLGIDVENFRMLCLILMAVMTASIVAFTGILGFVGLVAPHIVRLVIGSDNRFVLPICMVVGATLMLIADYIAEVQLHIAIGVVISIIGSPIFFLLIVWQKKGKVLY